MLETLGLDDDWDPVDVVIAVEKSFDVKIDDAEANAIFHVGALHELLVQKLACSSDNHKCASAMAFYRLRRAMAELLENPKASPSFDLSPLRDAYTKQRTKELEKASGLRLPSPSFTTLGKIGGALAVSGFLACVACGCGGLILVLMGVVVSRILLGLALVLLVGGLIVGGVLAYLDPGRLPDNCQTLGALAARSRNLSFGRLIRQGASADRHDIWQTLVDLLADFADVPADQIAPETRFLKRTPAPQRTARA